MLKEYGIYYDKTKDIYFTVAYDIIIQLTSASLFNVMSNEFLNQYLETISELQLFLHLIKFKIKSEAELQNDGYLGQLTKENQYKINRVLDKYFITK